MAHFKTAWHGPSLVENDVSDLKGDYTDKARVPWYTNDASSSSSEALTAAIEGTGYTSSTSDIASFAITAALDGSNASGDEEQTYYLKSTNFGFNLPSHAVIDGIKIRWKCESVSLASGATDAVRDGRVYLLVGGSYASGTDGGLASGVWPAGTDATVGNDLGWEPARGGDGSTTSQTNWGYTTDILTPARANSSSFGVVFAAELTNEINDSNAFPCVEHIRMRLWYHIGSYKGNLLSSSVLNNWNGSEPDTYPDDRIDDEDQEDTELADQRERKFLDSSEAHLFKASNATLQTGASFAFSLWARAEVQTSGTHPLVGKTGGSDDDWEYLIESSEGKIRVTMAKGGSTLTTKTSASTVFSDLTTWHHLVFNFNGTEMRIYDNEVYLESLIFPDGNDADDGKFAIGGKPDYSGAAHYADMTITQVGFWKCDTGFPLGESDVILLNNDGIGLYYAMLPSKIKTNLISYWNLDENSGNAVDSHGTNVLGAEGTITGVYDLDVPALSYNNLASTNLIPSIHMGDIGNFDSSASGRS